MVDISLENVFKIVIQCSPNTKRSVSEISPRVHFFFTQLMIEGMIFSLLFATFCNLSSVSWAFVLSLFFFRSLKLFI